MTCPSCGTSHSSTACPNDYPQPDAMTIDINENMARLTNISAAVTKQPTQLDRIEAKIDRILAALTESPLAHAEPSRYYSACKTCGMPHDIRLSCSDQGVQDYQWPDFCCSKCGFTHPASSCPITPLG